MTKTYHEGGILAEYEFSLQGESYRDTNGMIIRPRLKYETTDGVILDRSKLGQAVSTIRYSYDRFRRRERLIRNPKIGTLGATVLGVTALITGLSLGLRRTGSNIVRNAKERAKIGPSEKLWTELQESAGKAVITAGDHIYVIIGETAYIWYTRGSK